MRTFQYLKPTSVEGAVELLDKYSDRAKVIAGGTDLMIQWKKRLLSPEFFISLRNVADLNFTCFDDGLVIGSATTHRTIELSAAIERSFPILTDAVKNLGSVQVRNSATIGGNICNAAPSADTAPPLLALDAEVRTVSTAGVRSIPIESFFKGPGRTNISHNEIVKEFVIPKPLRNTGMAYLKHSGRKAMDLPIIGVGVLLSFAGDMKTCVKARIALGVAGPTPMRAKAAESFLEGKPIDEKTLTAAGEIAAQEASPRTTIRGSEWYRLEMVRVLVKRAGMICPARAKGDLF